MIVTKTPFGTAKTGEQTHLYTIKNSSGAYVVLTDYGASIVSIVVPDRDGKLNDVVMGFDTIESYEGQTGSVGATIGRCANRIIDARFTLNGKEYNLAKNCGRHHIHGGPTGFGSRVWQGEVRGDSVSMTYISADGEENYPGRLKVNVTFTFTENNSLQINYFAISDKDTVCNLTNHSYFNLSGHSDRTIENHMLKINADYITEYNSEVVATGEITAVKGTPMDFNTSTRVGERINEKYPMLEWAGGYDHTFIIRRPDENDESLTLAAELISPKTGRVLEAYTTQPVIHLYAGNYIVPDYRGKEGVFYHPRCALCLEAQHFPNAVNFPQFKTTVIKAQKPYTQTTIYKFKVQQ